MGGGWLALMIIGMLVFWTVLVIGIVMLVRHYGPRGSAPTSQSRSNSSVEILKERFARGELTEEEYLRHRKLLEGDA
jgi:putative membrane protein